MYTVYCLYIHIYYLCLYYLNYTFYMNHLKIVNVYTYIHKDTRTHAYIQTYTHTHTHLHLQCFTPFSKIYTSPSPAKYILSV